MFGRKDPQRIINQFFKEASIRQGLINGKYPLKKKKTKISL
jgi:hypothetical protein